MQRERKSSCTTMIGNNDDGGMFREDGELSKKPRNNIFPHALDDS